jgi:ABC-type multidrug transport system fused ATPase/permease subunit
MRYKSFARARKFGRRSIYLPLAVYVSGVAAAFALSILVLLVPLAIELFEASRHAFEPGGASYFGKLTAGLFSSLNATTAHRYLLWGFFLGIALSGLIAGTLYWLEQSAGWFAARLAASFRKQIYVQTHSLGACDLFIGSQIQPAELIADKVDAVAAAQVAWWRVFPHATVFSALMLVLAMTVDFWLSLASILLAIACWRIVVQTDNVVRRYATLMADRAQHYLAILLDYLSHNRLLGNLANDGSDQRDAFDENLGHYETAVLKREGAMSARGPLVVFLALSVTTLIVTLAGVKLLQSPPRLSLSEVVLLISALAALAYPAIRFLQVQRILPAADESAFEIFAYLDRQPAVGQVSQAMSLVRLAREINLEHVDLRDNNGRPLINGVSVKFAAGEKAVIFSSTDEASFALAGLLARFCDPTAGRILYDGRDTKTVTLTSLRQQIALVLPERILFTGTLHENITGGDTRFTADAVIDALKAAHAYDFIQPLPEGLETIVGPHGLTLTPGQSLRLGMARVLLTRPSLVIVEEPAEEFDEATGEKVAMALDQATADCAVIILARRLGVLRAARRILVLHEGRLVAEGTHQVLLAQNDLYRHLNYVRFNEFRSSLR